MPDDVPALRASVVVVSRHRPGPLALCLSALTLQDHPAFEIVLVADPGSVGLRPDLPPQMAGLFQRPERSTRVENDAEKLKSLILERRSA